MHLNRQTAMTCWMLICTLLTLSATRGEDFLPEPPAVRHKERVTPYSVVIFGLPDNVKALRQLLKSVRDLGATKVQVLVYWWKYDTMGGDYWKEMGYAPSHIGEDAWKMLDAYVEWSHKFGLRPAMRMGTRRVFKGLYHPEDKSGSPEKYGEWLEQLARRYRGKIDHYNMGDEENKSFPEWGWVGTPENYIKEFIPLAEAIKRGDPDAMVGPTSVSSAPATDWSLKLVDLGLPKYADGMAAHFSYQRIESLLEITDYMERVRKKWPEARFFANGMGYADHRHLEDMQQAGIVAQSMFTMWDIGWDSAPYYCYLFSQTADTNQNFGLMRLKGEKQQAEYSAAWKAYQTIAHTFYDRHLMESPSFDITLRQGQQLKGEGGVSIQLAPPNPVLRSFIRADGQLLIYLAYRQFRVPQTGIWDITVDSADWGKPQQIPLSDYQERVDLPHHRESSKLVIEGVKAGLQPAVLTLRRVKH